MSLVRSLAPAAVFVVAVSLVTLWLLVDGSAIGPWLLALLLAAHGWVHLMYLFPKPSVTPGAPPYPFDFDRSWLIDRARLDAGRVRQLGTLLVVGVAILHTLAALSTVGLLVPGSWWAGLVVAAALSSSLALALLWSPTLLLGVIIDLALLWLVASGTWSPGAG
jgi:hypothetical protein